MVGDKSAVSYAYIKNKRNVILLIVSVISIALTITFLSFIFGIYFALGYVLLTISHEAGHYFAAKKLNFSVESFAFFPFMAYVKFRESAKNCREDAIISFGGPISESIVSLVYLMFYTVTGDNVTLALAFIGLSLALLNLIPANLLDGGRIAGAIDPKIWFTGIPMLVFILILTKEPLILILILLAASDCYKRITSFNRLADFYRIDKNTRLIFTGTYFSLVLSLFAALAYMHYVINIKHVFGELLKI